MLEATCETCGESNPRGTPFCSGCGSYLAWQDDEQVPATSPGTAAAVPVTAPADPVGAPAQREPAPPQVVAAPSASSTRTRSVQAPPALPPSPVVSPAAPRPSVTASPPAPAGGSTCPAGCGADNAPRLRFCRRCGATLGSGGVPGADQRPGGDPSTRWGSAQASLAARRAYRQSLPARYRAGRVIAGLLTVVAVGGMLAIVGQNPVGWAQQRWYAARGTLEPVTGLTATASSAKGASADYPPGHATDGPVSTAWGTEWRGGGSDEPGCGVPIRRGGRATLLLTLPQQTTLRGVDIASGLPKTDRARLLQWRPTALRLTFDDGTCQVVRVDDTDGLQRRPLTSVDSAVVRVDITTAARPASGKASRVAVAEVRLLRRPG